MSRNVYYLIAIDDDHKPVHTTKICGTLTSALETRNRMAETYEDVVICQKITPDPSSPA